MKGCKRFSGFWGLQFLIQKVVTSEEAEEMIASGWKFVGVLPNSKVVLEKHEKAR